MPRKTKLKAGDHRCMMIRRKAGTEKATVIYSTPGCRCGWKGEETQSATSALEQFDKHMDRLKRGEEP